MFENVIQGSLYVNFFGIKIKSLTESQDIFL